MNQNDLESTKRNQGKIGNREMQATIIPSKLSGVHASDFSPNMTLGRSRSRISASGYSTWLDVQQWFLTRKVGLSSPTSVFRILGVVVEDALIDLLMHRPDNFLLSVHNWAKQKFRE